MQYYIIFNSFGCNFFWKFTAMCKNFPLIYKIFHDFSQLIFFTVSYASK